MRVRPLHKHIFSFDTARIGARTPVSPLQTSRAPFTSKLSALGQPKGKEQQVLRGRDRRAGSYLGIDEASAMSTITAEQGEPLPTIILNKTEEALCVLLNDACRWIQTSQPQPDPVESGGVRVEYGEGWTLEARIAGGWVRDKLLGLESHDLDISLSTLTGHIFALLLREYLLSSDFAASALAKDTGSPFHASGSSSETLVGHITKIAANPEQSKNLETATAKVAGLQLDFVNLRKEVYLGDSRIPTMTFGTAHEDAERRDITINTLFYNIQSRKVEDMTGLGLSDMKNKIVRTPLPPQRTFFDDPLRVLRCVRFASRFGYEVHPSILECFYGVEGEALLEALRSKVSRERFGIEVDKMMRGPDPKRAVDLISQMNLFQVIFYPPPDSKLKGKASPNGEDEVARAVQLLEAFEKKLKSWPEGDVDLLPDVPVDFLMPLVEVESRRLLWYSAMLLPLRDVEWEEKKGKWSGAGECVIFNGLKLAGNTRKAVADMAKSSQILHRPTAQAFDASSGDYRGIFITELSNYPLSPRATMALLIRLRCISAPEHGLNVKLCLLWAAIEDYARGKGSIDEFAASSGALKSYLEFSSTLETNFLLHRVQERVLLDGKEVQEVLQIRPGKDLQIILKRVEAWQFDADTFALDHDQAKEACKEWLAKEWASGGIIPIEQREASKGGGSGQAKSDQATKKKKKLKGE